MVGLRPPRGILSPDDPRAARHAIPEAHPPAMPTSQVLQYLYSLDTSSPDFLRCLYCFILDDEGEQYSSNLQGSELARLVNFLDEVCSLRPDFQPVMKHILQTLCTIPVTDNIYRQCLHKLQAICEYHMTLPCSYNASDDLVKIGGYPIADGGFADVWEGTHRGRKVCIKCLRVSVKNRETVTKVCTRYRHDHSALLENTHLCAPQSFFREAVLWKRLRHPNIVPFISVSTKHLQFVSEYMPNGTLTEYVRKRPGADRIGLVSLSSVSTTWLTTSSSLVIRCGRRSRLSSRKLYDTRRLERGKCLL